MTAKHYLKIAAFVAFALLWHGTVPRASAGQKQKTRGYHSSIQVPPSEKDEAKLQAAAKITPEDAKAAAVKRYQAWPVKYVMIRNIKGNLVYEVEFQDDKEFIIDAGTGELLTKSQEEKKK